MPAPGFNIKVCSVYCSNGVKVAVLYVRDRCRSYDSINWGWGLTFGFLDCSRRGCWGYTIIQTGMEKGLSFHPKIETTCKKFCVKEIEIPLEQKGDNDS